MTKKQPIKKKNGRPLGSDEYRQEYDQMIIDCMEKGASAVEFAASVGVAKSTIYEWAKNHQSFSNAFTRARTMCQAWWERQGRTNLQDKTERDEEAKITTTTRFNDRLWNKNMACRFRDEWVEKKDISLSVPLDSDKNLLAELLKKPDATK